MLEEDRVSGGTGSSLAPGCTPLLLSLESLSGTSARPISRIFFFFFELVEFSALLVSA